MATSSLPAQFALSEVIFPLWIMLAFILPPALSAPPASPIHHDVVIRKLMAFVAMSFPCITCRSRNASKCVGAVGDRLKVGRIDARWHAAEMVNNEAGRDLPY